MASCKSPLFSINGSLTGFQKSWVFLTTTEGPKFLQRKKNKRRREYLNNSYGKDHLKSYAAKTQYDTKKITHESIVADLASIPTVPDNSVDLYIASFLLEFVAEPVKVLKEAHRVLKKGGKLAIVSTADIPKNSYAALVIQAAKDLKLPTTEDFLRLHLFANRDLLNGYIKEAGFKLHYQWEESVTVNVKTFEDYKKHILENPLSLGYTLKLDTETQAKFEARVKEIYEELKKNGEPIISKAVSSICVKE